MSDKMQPGKFTLRFNMNDPQQQAAADYLNRMGRQKAPFLARAIVHYMECQETPQIKSAAVLDEHTLEQAILTVLTKHPSLMRPDASPEKPVELQETPKTERPEGEPPVWDDVMSEEGLSAITKTLAAFRRQ